MYSVDFFNFKSKDNADPIASPLSADGDIMVIFSFSNINFDIFCNFFKQ